MRDHREYLFVNMMWAKIERANKKPTCNRFILNLPSRRFFRQTIIFPVAGQAEEKNSYGYNNEIQSGKGNYHTV